MKTPIDQLMYSFKMIDLITNQNPALKNFNENVYKKMEYTVSLKRIQDVVDQNLQMIQGSARQDDFLKSAISIKWNSLYAINQAYKTPELDNLQRALQNNQAWGIDLFVSSINLKRIESSHLAVLKEFNKNPLLRKRYLKRLSVSMDKINVGTIAKVSKSNKLTLDAEHQFFYVTTEPQKTATLQETNIICSGLDLFSGLDEAELIRFQDFLSRTSSLAATDETGQKILNILSDWKDAIDFDQDYYYHGRGLNDGICPYTEDQLRQAPYGVTGPGRFNFAGQSRFYFSDKKKGVMAEIMKHSKPQRVHLVKPRDHVKMLDLSAELAKPNKFLDFCRYVPDYNTYSNLRREYLIPAFVADCCYRNGIDGIKYYGSREYTNYVTWDDRHFAFAEHDVIPVEKLSEIKD